MIETLAHEGGWGLAGPQVDYPWRLIVLMVPGFPQLDVMVNPKITKRFSTAGSKEGCLSVGRGIPRVFKKRARNITVQYQDVLGFQHEVKARGDLAACIQHEIEHLQGILLTD